MVEEHSGPFGEAPAGEAWRETGGGGSGVKGDSIRARLEDAHMRYLRALQEAWCPEEYRRQADDTALDAARSARATFEPEAVQDRLNQGTSEYVRAVQEAVASLDPDSVDMVTIGAIGQSLAAASWVAACSGAASRRPYATSQWGWGWGARAW